MKESYISTKEVAGLFNVTETTIKRWTDNGSLTCVKTLGGHRKYLLKDIEQFAKVNNLPFSGIPSHTTGSSMERLGYAIYSNNMSLAAEVILEEALLGNRESIFQHLMYLARNKKKLMDIVDEIIHPVMIKIGELWEDNKIKVEQEHLVSDSIKTALARLVVYLPQQPRNDITVVCACCEGEYHDMGLQSLAYELELSGYTIKYLGANTPFQAISNVIKEVRPEYVCLSASTQNIPKKEFIYGITNVVKAAKKTKTKVITGGSYFQNFDSETLGSDAIVTSIKETISFIKNNNKKGN